MAGFVETTESADALNASQKVVERSDALLKLHMLANIAPEKGLICHGMLRVRVAASFGGELMALMALMAFHRHANLIEHHFGSKGLDVIECQSMLLKGVF